MKTIIAGSRNIEDGDLLEKAIAQSGFRITEVVCGCARGVDLLGQQWANRNNVQVRHFYADWAYYGKSAGPIRNVEMAEYADALIAIWDGGSKGTKHMLDTARKLGLVVFVHNTSTNVSGFARRVAS